MLIFEFRLSGQRHITTGHNLLDATATLPHDWQTSNEPLEVISYPASELDYYKARCHDLERQVCSLLRSH